MDSPPRGLRPRLINFLSYSKAPDRIKCRNSNTLHEVFMEETPTKPPHFPTKIKDRRGSWRGSPRSLANLRRGDMPGPAQVQFLGRLADLGPCPSPLEMMRYVLNHPRGPGEPPLLRELEAVAEAILR
jgi:hypothetical protein